MEDDPFALLRLPSSATEEEIVRQGARLSRTAPDEAARNALREAVRALTSSPEERLLRSLLTPPGAPLETKGLERFIALHRKPPTGEAVEIPSVDQEEVRAILRGLRAAEWEILPAPLEEIADTETPAEIEKQTSEAIWASLLFDTRG